MQAPANAPQSKFNRWAISVTRRLSQEGVVWDHQRDALLAAQTHFLNQANPDTALIVLPTGSGKSGIIALAPYVLNATKVLVITPSAIITRQLAVSMGLNSFYYQALGVNANDFPGFVESATVVYGSWRPEYCLPNLVIANAHKFGATANVNLDDIPANSFDLIIVDEAHHYPAPTWTNIVNRFAGSKKLFLTATPYYRGNPILPDAHICFTKSLASCITDGIIRAMDFEEVGNNQDSNNNGDIAVAQKIVSVLQQHDQRDPRVSHQAMVLTYLTTEADRFNLIFNQLYPGTCAAYHGTTSAATLTNFHNGQLRVLVVCGKLLEGFDQKTVSAVAIRRNVGSATRVMFSQFVGRSLRRIDSEVNGTSDITAQVISHVSHSQHQNFQQLNEIADVDPADD